MLMKRALTLVAGAALALTLAACGSSSDTATSSTSAAAASTSAAATSEAMTSEAMTSGEMSSDAMSSDAMSSGDMAAPAALVGAGCADYAEQVPTGAGSVEVMALVPVAVSMPVMGSMEKMDTRSDELSVAYNNFPAGSIRIN